MGNGSVIGVGDVQRMTAGTGVRHSEFNASHDVPVHLLQIWITPSENNLTPSYEEKNFSRQEKENQWRLIASRNGHDGSITIHQDVNLYATILTPQKQEKLPIAPNRCAYVQVVSGEILLEDNQLIAGDAAKISEEQLINILALQESELLWFDLPIQSMQ
jgi:redox-sensitive bicupin YhaK (pirin superfamily)